MLTLCLVLVSFTADQTVGHEILDLEREVGAEIEDYATLNSILCQAKMELKVPNKPTKESVAAFLTEARNLVISQGFREADNQLEEPRLLCGALQAKIFDCDTLSFILVSIAEELNLPLKGAMAPGHMFVIWRKKGETLLWDSRSGKEVPYAKAHTFVHLSVPITPPYDLKPLSHKELVACGRYNVAAVLLVDRADYFRSLEVAHDALKSNSSLLIAQVLRGHCFQGLGNLAQAEQDYQAVLKKNPYCVAAWCALSEFHASQGNLDSAITAISKALEIAPDDPDLYLWRGLKYQERAKVGDEELAAKDFGQVLSLDPVFLAGHLKKK